MKGRKENQPSSEAEEALKVTDSTIDTLNCLDLSILSRVLLQKNSLENTP